MRTPYVSRLKPEKTCRRCQKRKSRNLFERSNRPNRAIGELCLECRAVITPRQKGRTKAQYKQDNRKKLAADQIEYRKRNPGKFREWTQRNSDHRKRYMKSYRETNRRRLADQQNRYVHDKRRTDPEFKLLLILRGGLYDALKGRRKAYNAVKLLGCSLASFRMYIESKFEPGMSWKNHGTGEGKWHLDHIIPCALFDLRKQSHQKWCFHFSNLQPLWEIDNLKKGATIPNELTEVIKRKLERLLQEPDAEITA